MALKSLNDLGCSWSNNIDSRGVEFGGALYNRTSDIRHKELVREVFTDLLGSNMLSKQTMEQYCSISGDVVRFLPDRYVEGTCPVCEASEARGDQCDECGSTYEAHELISPVSKLDPEASIEVRDTDHLFFRLDMFQDSLESHAALRNTVWKPNVRSMTKNWLDMGLRPRAVTRDIDWGIELPMDGDEWSSKRVYVWFEAVQGYYTCARIWSERFANANGHPDGDSAWERWWKVSDDGQSPKHIYFMGKDNIPFHALFWPAQLMAVGDKIDGEELHLPDVIPANQYVTFKGGKASASRGIGLTISESLEVFEADSLRYALAASFPEQSDTELTVEEICRRINEELVATWGNLVNRVLSMIYNSCEATIPSGELRTEEDLKLLSTIDQIIERAGQEIDNVELRSALQTGMSGAAEINAYLNSLEPRKLSKTDPERAATVLGTALSAIGGVRVCLSPYLPFSTQLLD
mgnify:CR=1 FL=1